MELIADTTYLVGLWRGQQWATSYAAANPSESLALPWIVLGEFWHGATLAGHDANEVREFLSLGIHLTDAMPAVPVYSKICAELSSSTKFRNIGQNDLWIAAVSMASDKPLLTRNRRHFDLIKGLKLRALQD